MHLDMHTHCKPKATFTSLYAMHVQVTTSNEMSVQTRVEALMSMRWHTSLESVYRGYIQSVRP